MKLLTTNNPKIVKSEKLGFLTAILHLAPARLSGFNVCPMATKGCAAACLNTAGRGGMFPGRKTGELSGEDMVLLIESGWLHNRIQSARIRKTRMFFNERNEFMAQLAKEIGNFIKLAAKHGLTPVIRLNGTSDIRWETVEVSTSSMVFPAPNIMAMFPTIQFYDYTKIPNRRNLPANYHLTFSLAESNDEQAQLAIANGMNVAVVFRTKDFPNTFMGLPVVNGDETDLRFLDNTGSIVALKAKGKARKDDTGFVREIA